MFFNYLCENSEFYHFLSIPTGLVGNCGVLRVISMIMGIYLVKFKAFTAGM